MFDFRLTVLWDTEMRNAMKISSGLAAFLAVLVMGCDRDERASLPSSLGESSPIPDISNVVSELREAGYTVELTDLDSSYPTPPTKVNSAKYYQEAFAFLSDYPSKNGRAIHNVAEVSGSIECFDAAKMIELQRYFDQNKVSIESLRKAVEFSDCRYEVDLAEGSKVLLPHLKPLRNCSNLLFAHSLVSACEGDAENAIETILTNLALAESLKYEPILLSQRVRGSALTYTARSIEGLLNRANLDDSQLHELQNRLISVDLLSGVRRAMVGELALFLDVFQNWESYADSFRTMGFDYNEGFVPSIQDLRASVAIYKQALELFENLLPFSRERHQQLLNEIAKARQQGLRLTSDLMPSRISDLSKLVRDDSTIRLATIAIAMKRYSLANEGSFPEQLDQISRYFEEGVPTDSFTGFPFRLRVRSPRNVELSGNESPIAPDPNTELSFSVRTTR